LSEAAPPAGPAGGPCQNDAPAIAGRPAGAEPSAPVTAFDAQHATWSPPAADWGPSPSAQRHHDLSGDSSRRRQYTRFAVIAVLVTIAIVLGVAISRDFRQWRAATASQTQPVGGLGSGGSSSFAGTVDASAPSDLRSVVSAAERAVVDIDITLAYQSGEAAGTGIVLTDSGLVLTNNHVIDGATAISAVDVGDGRAYSATVVGYDRSHDVALIQLGGAVGLATAQIGDSSRVKGGQTVVAIGNAGGVGGTPVATSGVLLGHGLRVLASNKIFGSSEQLDGLFGTNAAVRPGDSGGPLIDTAGRVIGIDTAASNGYLFSSGNGEGFAIPVKAAMSVAAQIESQTDSATVHIGPTAFLGVEFKTGGAGGGNQGSDHGGGAFVASVFLGSPAAQAGLAAGDTIVSLDGRDVDSPSAVSSALGRCHPGDIVQVGWADPSGTRRSGTVQLGTGPAA
jgi:S1-C subfamily serine protease